ncbi:hypothetical protein K2173_020919 [Erythroxylum novogranatense]|uniref:Cucumisin n=1 Tax=Erythroxylum novogranatense TaxID=1862640 RepID=A0AAV8TPA7_9ROSI|nr:hypothetical protein K2173_020919 [Erythroxylum novogranatense]
MGELSHLNSHSVINANREIIASVTQSFDEAQNVTVHHYTRIFRGFSTMLTEQQAHRLKGEYVVSVFERRMNRLHTTHLWDFLRINYVDNVNQFNVSSSVTNIIIGVVNSVWPESKSFNDHELGPVPNKFKGECVTGQNLTSNNYNRARFYSKGYEIENGPLESFEIPFFQSPRDSDGHGLFGMANGTARGGAPNARLAIYKACWFDQCKDADVLSAMDDAISDGVDILSLSFGFDPPQPSVFVSCSARNTFFLGIVTNVTPWITTVAASTVDREFSSNIYLGNSQGFSVNPLTMESSHTLVAESDAATKIKGNIVICAIQAPLANRLAKALVVQQGGGARMKLVNPNVIGVGFQFVILVTIIGHEEVDQLQAYLKSDKNPTVRIAPIVTKLNTKLAPKVVVFSFRGPNVASPDIITIRIMFFPDITGPGVSILATWSPLAIDSAGGRSIDYNIVSGTSMSCPHAATIIKSYEPSWNNTLKSITRDPNGTISTPFDYDSGHIKPKAAVNPGLVYDYNLDNLINFLCSTGANPEQLKNLTGQLTYCQKPVVQSYDFNYPSIDISNMQGSVSVHRTVKYYGEGPSFFVASIDYPDGVLVKVTPAMLKFARTDVKMSFRIDFTPQKTSNGDFVFGALTWNNGVQRVRSPIALNVTSVWKEILFTKVCNRETDNSFSYEFLISNSPKD